MPLFIFFASHRNALIDSASPSAALGVSNGGLSASGAAVGDLSSPTSAVGNDETASSVASPAATRKTTLDSPSSQSSLSSAARSSSKALAEQLEASLDDFLAACNGAMDDRIRRERRLLHLSNGAAFARLETDNKAMVDLEKSEVPRTSAESRPLLASPVGFGKFSHRGAATNGDRRAVEPYVTPNFEYKMKSKAIKKNVASLAAGSSAESSRPSAPARGRIETMFFETDSGDDLYRNGGNMRVEDLGLSSSSTKIPQRSKATPTGAALSGGNHNSSFASNASSLSMHTPDSGSYGGTARRQHSTSGSSALSPFDMFEADGDGGASTSVMRAIIEESSNNPFDQF